MLFQPYIILFFISCTGLLIHSQLTAQTPAPEFPDNLIWLNTSKPLTIQHLKGKVILLDFWTHCCINCLHILPELKKLEKEFPQLVVIGVHSAKFTNEKQTKAVNNAIARYQITHPVVLDTGFAIWNAYQIKAWPTLVVINPKGHIVWHQSGENQFENLRQGLIFLTAQFPKDITDNRSDSVATDTITWYFPTKICADTIEKRLFVSDLHRIRIINTAGKVLQTIGTRTAGKQDGHYTTAQFNRPQGLAYDYKNKRLFIADTENHLIRQLDLKNQQVTTLAGNGKKALGYRLIGNALDIALASPWDITLTQNDKLIIAMAGTHQLYQYDFRHQTLTLLSGTGEENLKDGAAPKAALAQPSGITAIKDSIFFLDSESSALRKLYNSTITTLIGTGLFDFGDIDTVAHLSKLQHPIGITHYSDSVLLIADTYNHKIKACHLTTRNIKTLLDHTILNEPEGIAVIDNTAYICNTNSHQIITLNLKDYTHAVLPVSF